MPKVKHRGTFRVAPDYSRDKFLRRILNRETKEPTRIFIELM